MGDYSGQLIQLNIPVLDNVSMITVSPLSRIPYMYMYVAVLMSAKSVYGAVSPPAIR